MAHPADPKPRGIHLATLGGVPVYIGWSWLLMAAIIVALVGPNIAYGRPDLGLLAYLVAVGYALILLVAVLAHEGAHAAVARAFGHRVHQVVANLWGGHTAYDPSRARPGSMAAIAVAGPLTNGALALVAWTLIPSVPPGVASGLVAATAFINAALMVFNLLPGLPLDGGQVVEAAIWKATGRKSSGRIAAGWSGRVLVVTLILVAIGIPMARGDQGSLTTTIWIALIGAFMWSGASGAVQQGRAMGLVERVDLRSVVEPVFVIPIEAPLTALTDQHATPIVVNSDGRPLGLVSLAAAGAVPLEVRDTTPVTAVLARQPSDWVVETSPGSEVLDIIRGFQTTGRPVLAVVSDGTVLGLVSADRINAALGALDRSSGGAN